VSPPTGKGNRELVRRARRTGADEEVELPAGAQPAAQRVAALLAVRRLAAAAAVVIDPRDRIL